MKIDIPDYNVPFLLPSGLVNPVWYEKLKPLFDGFNAIDAAARFDKTGATAGQTGLLLWDVDNGTIERVTVGDPGSGGGGPGVGGFKVLRIPN